MELTEILKKIESTIKEENKKFESSNYLSETDSNSNASKNILHLVILYFLKLFKSPFTKKYFSNLIKIAKKDARLYAMIMGILSVLFIFFTVLWLFISTAIGFYFYEKGNTLFISILYSIGFQMIFFVSMILIGYFGSKRITSLKMVKSLSKHLK